jgi:hypothetical protein
MSFTCFVMTLPSVFRSRWLGVGIKFKLLKESPSSLVAWVILEHGGGSGRPPWIVITVSAVVVREMRMQVVRMM